MTASADFHHQAFFYADSDELLAGAVPFIRDGLERGEAVMVALPERNLSAVRGELAGDGPEIQWVEMEDLGRNPARIIPAWREFTSAHVGDGARGARGIGEPIWAGRTEVELDECDRHESLLNLAFAGRGAWNLMCPYNTSELPAAVLERAELNHPHIAGTGEVRRAADYLDPRRRTDLLRGSLAGPPRETVTVRFDAGELRRLRRLVGEHAAAAGLSHSRVADLVLAASEVGANATEHATVGEVRLWETEGEVVCEISSDGEIRDPMIGRVKPDIRAVRGRGLWIVNQVCDLVQIRSGERTTVRMLMAKRRGATSPDPRLDGAHSAA